MKAIMRSVLERENYIDLKSDVKLSLHYTIMKTKCYIMKRRAVIL